MPDGLEKSTKQKEKEASHRNVSPPVTLLPSGTGPGAIFHADVKTLMVMSVCVSHDLHKEVSVLDLTLESQGNFGKNHISRLNFLESEGSVGLQWVVP